MQYMNVYASSQCAKKTNKKNAAWQSMDLDESGAGDELVARVEQTEEVTSEGTAGVEDGRPRRASCADGHTARNAPPLRRSNRRRGSQFPFHARQPFSSHRLWDSPRGCPPTEVVHTSAAQAARLA